MKKKILDDVDEICSRPELGADVIVVFTEKNIPIGVQNELRTRVAYEHDVVLHVLDGNAIADLLAAHDLNWLAHRYLDLPAEASPAPRADEDDAWYLEQRLKWTDASPRPAWGDVEDLRQSLRHAYQHGFTADATERLARATIAVVRYAGDGSGSGLRSLRSAPPSRREETSFGCNHKVLAGRFRRGATAVPRR